MFGVWNDVQKRFVFGIKEPSAQKAWKALYKKIYKDAYKYRYFIRVIPDGWVNPANPNYKKEVKKK